jgi:hypothetical protein
MWYLDARFRWGESNGRNQEEKRTAMKSTLRFLMTVITAALTGLTGLAQTSLTNGLAAYYPLDGNTLDLRMLAKITVTYRRWVLFFFHDVRSECFEKEIPGIERSF